MPQCLDAAPCHALAAALWESSSAMPASERPRELWSTSLILRCGIKYHGPSREPADGSVSDVRVRRTQGHMPRTQTAHTEQRWSGRGRRELCAASAQMLWYTASSLHDGLDYRRAGSRAH